MAKADDLMLNAPSSGSISLASTSKLRLVPCTVLKKSAFATGDLLTGVASVPAPLPSPPQATNKPLIIAVITPNLNFIICAPCSRIITAKCHLALTPRHQLI